jgi:ketosteroid isomerase-like protein
VAGLMTDDLARTANELAFREVIAAVNAGDGERARPHLADDVVYQAPYYDLDIKGVDELVRMFGALVERFSSIDYRITEVIPGLDPDVLVVEARGDHAVRSSEKRYRNLYLLVVRFVDGRIARWTEYSDPTVFKEAMV